MEKSHVSSFGKGMKNGIDPSVFPSDSVVSMLNGHIDDKDLNGYTVTNIRDKLALITLTAGYAPIGYAQYEDSLYIISTNGTNVEFGVYNGTEYIPFHNLYTTIGGVDTLGHFNLSKTLLALDFSSMVHVIASKDYDGHINLYVCDGVHMNIVVNSGTTYYNTTTNPLDPSELSQFRSTDRMPVITGTVVVGGALKPGNVFMAVRYTTNDMNSTIFTTQLGPFVISQNGKGVISGMDNHTDKAIRLDLTSIDVDYMYLEIAIIRYFGVDGTLSVETGLIDRKYSGSTAIVITGEEPLLDITIEEILMNNIAQDRCVDAVITDDRYVGANWKTSDADLNSKLADVALHIIPSVKIKEATVADAVTNAMARDYSVINAETEMKYKPGEMYPFGVSFVIGGKYVTDVYPIIGYDSNIYTVEMVEQIIETGGYKIYNIDSESIMDEIVSDDHNRFNEQIYSTYKFSPILTSYVPVVENYNFLRLTNTWNPAVSPVIFFNTSDDTTGWTEHIIKYDHIYADPIFDYHGVKTYLFETTVMIVNNSFYIDGASTDINVIVGLMTIDNIDDKFSFTQSNKLIDDLLPEDMIESNFYDNSRIVFNIANGNWRLIRKIEISFHGTVSAYGQDLTFDITHTYNKFCSILIIETDMPIPTGVHEQLFVPVPSGANYMSFCGDEQIILYAFGNEVSVPNFDGQSGLFRFPIALDSNNINGDYRKLLHYSMVGVQFDNTLAVPYMDGLDITGMIFMQGNRVKNCMGQGFAIPMIDRVIIHPTDHWTTWVSGDNMYHTGTFIYAFGNGRTKTMFPWLCNNVQNDPTDYNDGSHDDKYNFPIMFSRNQESNVTELDYRHLGYVSPFFKRLDFTADQGFIDEAYAPLVHRIAHTTPKERMHLFQITAPANPDDYLSDAVLSANNISECVDWAFMSPDEVIDRDDFNGVFRSLCLLTATEMTSEERESLRIEKPVVADQYNVFDRNFLYGHEYAAQIADNFKDDKIFKFSGSSIFVEEDRVIPNDQGCVSRMKSVDEIFGSMNGDPHDYFNTTMLGKTRQQLLDAGLFLNRFVFLEDKQLPGATVFHEFRDNNEIFGGWRYGASSEPSNNYLETPTVLCNLPMRSTPYGHFSWRWADKVVSSYMMEKYLYDPDAVGLYETLKATFNIMSELFHPIIHVNNPTTIVASRIAYKGDVYAQQVSFRLNHWTMDALDNPYVELYRHGQYIKSYMEQFHNYNLRTTDLDKTFMPYSLQQGFTAADFTYKSSDNRVLKESWSFNEGNHQLQGIMQRYGINTDLPLIDIDKPNRLYYSDKALPGAYYDAWRNIRVGQYKDINVNLGPIQALVEKQDRLFAIHSFGVTQIYQTSKTQTIDDSSRIIIGNTDFLSDFRELTTFGTQHPQSVVKTDNGFYYVDWRNKKIINVSLKVTAQGSQFYYAEDMLEGKTLNQFFADLAIAFHHTDFKAPLLNDLFGVDGHISGIVSGYNPEKKEVYFTFLAGSALVDQGDIISRTLVYSETRGVFTGYYDYNPSMYLRFKDKLLIYVVDVDPEGYSSIVEQLESATTYKNFEISFYVNGLSEQENLSNQEKEFLVHQIFSSYNLLSADAQIDKMITWETEWQNGHEHMYTDFVGGIRYWKVPEFIEHLWRVPVCEQQSVDNGPKGSKDLYTFEPGSSLRGPWLKVTIRYGGTDKIFLKNIITSFLISNA